MEFKVLFSILKKYLADGDDVPTFFRELVSIITTVPDEEWGTLKDPSSNLSDATIRSYTKRNLSKKFASAIVYRLTPNRLTKKIKSLKNSSREMFAADLNAYDSTITSENVSEKATALLLDTIKVSAGVFPNDKIKQQKQMQLALDLKFKYGDFLFGESYGYCPVPGCGKELEVTLEGKSQRTYEVAIIDKNKEVNPSNLIVMCPQCHAEYILSSNKKLTKELIVVKDMLSTHRQSVHLLDDLPLEEGIIGVIRKISKLKEKDLEDASLNPKEIKQKLSPSNDTAIYIMVNSYVTSYFIKIREIMTNLDKRKEIDYDEIQDQIHAMYKRLNKARKSNIEIFNEIVGKIHRVTLQDEIYCQIVVSYFVQSCEVFNAIT